MEKLIKDRFNGDILRETRQRYSIAENQIRLLDGFESFMYEFERGNESHILRIGHSHRRSVALIQGEVDWINYLAAGGASVAKAVLSKNGELVEQVDDQHSGQFLATAFVKAKGEPPWETEWNTASYEAYGRLIGQMHMLSKEYVLPNPAWKRPEWDDPGMLEIGAWLPDSETVVLDRFRQLKAHLDTLPKDRETYGLVHQDAHLGNMFVDEAGTITLFDFDDCAYSWYMNDIAIVLFYSAMGHEDEAAFTEQFMTHFLRGYRQHNQLDPAWLAEIPNFLKLREIDLYAIIHRSFDVENLEEDWDIRYMTGRKEKIENDAPYINFDFMTLAAHL